MKIDRQLNTSNSKILDENEVSLLVSALESMLPTIASDYIKSLGIDIESQVRFGSVAAKCREMREAKGQSVKEAAQQAKMPQYRLKAIESGMMSQIRRRDLSGYIEYLGIEEWFAEWERMNRGVVERFNA